MATKARARSTCQHCHCPIGLSRWTGWIDLSVYGTYDMCPAIIAAVHEPTKE